MFVFVYSSLHLNLSFPTTKFGRRKGGNAQPLFIDLYLSLAISPGTMLLGQYHESLDCFENPKQIPA